jgi:hypothetical protein
MFPAKYLNSLHVQDCVNFTTPALVDVIRFRKDSHTAFSELEEVDTDRPLYISSIDSMSVMEEVQMLTPEAMNWFHSNKGKLA